MLHHIRSWLNRSRSDSASGSANAESNRARSAVLRFWSSFSLNVGHAMSFDAESGTVGALGTFVEEVRPIPRLRSTNDPTPLDFYAPSVWHALAFLTYLDIVAKSTPVSAVSSEAEFTQVYGQRPIFRGQARSWPIRPTAWRDGDGILHHWRRQVLGELLTSFAGPTQDVILELVGQVRSQSQADAIAQHFGIATNLVDFTFSPLTAVYFACAASYSSPISYDEDRRLENCAVVYIAPFGNSVVESCVRTELPPIELERLYAQVGLFLDMGEPDPTFDKASALERQMRRVFFPREYPVFAERDIFHSCFGDFEPSVPFLSELVELVQEAHFHRGMEPPAEVAERLKHIVEARPPWRSIKHDPVWIYTDEDLLGVYRRVEYYVRFAGLMNLGGKPYLNPLLIKAFAGALAVPLIRFDDLLERIRAHPENPGVECALDGITWFNDKVLEAYKESYRTSSPLKNSAT